MANSVDELSFLTGIHHKCLMVDRAVDSLRQLIAMDAKLDEGQRNLFQAVFKQPIDQLRAAISTLDEHLMLERGGSCVELVQFIEDRRNVLIGRVEKLCIDALELITKSLLPASENPASIVFFSKLAADFHRYLGEVGKEGSYDEADRFYGEALSAAYANLDPADPTRLSTVLNVAVFRHDCQHNIDGATEILNTTVSEYEKQNKVSKPPQTENDKLIELMKFNLKQWAGKEDPEEDSD